MVTIQSLEQLQGVIQGVYDTMLVTEQVRIDDEKEFNYEVYKKTEDVFIVETEFIEYFVKPIFTGDHLQPADDAEPRKQDNILYVVIGDTTSDVEDAWIYELRRIEDADFPEVISRKEEKENYRF